MSGSLKNPEPFRIAPIFLPRIWGARSLVPLFPEKTGLPEPIGEAWLTGLDCRIASGSFAGKTLSEAWREMPAEWRGTRLASTAQFPLLVKFIFPKDKLSIQVHPDDAYAAAHEQAAGGRGKTEMWHIVSAEPGAHILVGLKPGVDRKRFREALSARTVASLLQSFEVHAGETYFIPARTPHTIGPGMIICEVQQYSDLTYRVYDYDRLDARGRPRELHIEKALEIIDFTASGGIRTTPLTFKHADMGQSIADKGFSLLAACKYFATEKWEISRRLRLDSDSDGFRVLTVLSGTGQIVWDLGTSRYCRGECWFMPACLGDCSLVPIDPTEFLNIYVPYLPAFLEELECIARFSRGEISKAVFT